jgi:hypothetical protein
LLRLRKGGAEQQELSLLEVCVFLSISFVRVFFFSSLVLSARFCWFSPFLVPIFLHLVFVEEEEEVVVEEAAGVGEGEEDGGGRKKNKKEENKKGDLNPWRWCGGECDIFVFFFFFGLAFEVWTRDFWRGGKREQDEHSGGRSMKAATCGSDSHHHHHLLLLLLFVPVFSDSFSPPLA